MTAIKSNEITLMPITKLKHYSKNRNKHTQEQVKRLAELIENYGFRDPLSVDSATYEVITGNGTLMAAKLLKMTEVPCILQTFNSEEERYGFSVSHNAIGAWSELDLSKIHLDLPDLDGFDPDLLGIKDFKFEPIMDPEKDKMRIITCPNCNEPFEEKQAKKTRSV